MKTIDTLVHDIYSLVGGEHGITDLLASDMGSNVANAIQQSLGPHPHRGLRLSGLGPKCPCALWYSVHRPDLAEPIPPYARIKFAYGHIIEHFIIGLAKAAGHDVRGEQDEIILDGILGHRDCVIDGAVVDVKSAASRSFLKFSQKTLAQDDSFGYLDQMDGYVLGSVGDPLVSIKDRGYFLAVDKTLGHLALYEHVVRESSIKERIRRYKGIVSLDKPPACRCSTETEDNGNVILGVNASYNSYKHLCFPKLRTFLYSGGPRFFVHVEKIPKYKGVPLVELTNRTNVYTIGDT